MISALGAEFEALSAKEKKDLDLENGVKISKLYPGKLKNETSIKEGFIITKINRKKVHSQKDITAMLENEKGGVLIEGYYPGKKDPAKVKLFIDRVKARRARA